MGAKKQKLWENLFNFDVFDTLLNEFGAYYKMFSLLCKTI